jgi:hypothetical protein
MTGVDGKRYLSHESIKEWQGLVVLLHNFELIYIAHMWANNDIRFGGALVAVSF